MLQQTRTGRRNFLLLTCLVAASHLTLNSDVDVSDAAPKRLSTTGKKDKRRNKKRDKKKDRKKGRRSKKNGSKNNGRSGSRRGTGNEIVREARRHKGAKYVWAGASPKGFDCSGFTWYVYKQVTGEDIGRTVQEQHQHGKSISRNALHAGDLVFFKNTFEKGLSHCGIYIANDDFIHAENESTGVVISSLNSDYYGKHYAGARRLI